jgi:mannosyltransferase OCH1-like enzyme
MKIIHQIYISDNNEQPSDKIQKQIKKLKKLYNNYEYKLYNNEDCRELIKKTVFGSFAVEIYDAIAPYAFKADFARYLILYTQGGYYYDISICPEYKFESDLDAILYESLPDPLITNNLRCIENNFMFFKEKNHPFLFKAIEKLMQNVVNREYGEHPLDVTSPIMLGRLDTTGITLGEVKFITKNQRGSYLNDVLHFKHKPIKFNANLSSLGCKGTNNYEELWFSNKLYNN